MLSTITAAEMQFRHETEFRGRELALLGSIRDRRAAQISDGTAHRAAAHLTSTHTPKRRATATPATWARPIGVKTAPTACAA